MSLGLDPCRLRALLSYPGGRKGRDPNNITRYSLMPIMRDSFARHRIRIPSPKHSARVVHEPEWEEEIKLLVSQTEGD